jgi:hypothetical protein
MGGEALLFPAVATAAEGMDSTSKSIAILQHNLRASEVIARAARQRDVELEDEAAKLNADLKAEQSGLNREEITAAIALQLKSNRSEHAMLLTRVKEVEKKTGTLREYIRKMKRDNGTAPPEQKK